MHVLLIRHAIAQDRAEFAATRRPDTERPLTKKGRDRMRDGALGLSRVVKTLDLLATSPLVRAVQTADIVADAYPDTHRETTDVMRPEASHTDFARWLLERRDHETVAAVGHDPHISGLAAWLIGAPDGALEMKKGSVLLIELRGEIAQGAGVLRWFMKPKQLRKLATSAS